MTAALGLLVCAPCPTHPAGTSTDTTLLLISTLAAAVAAVAAVVALWFAWQTVRDARAERRYRRVERVGRIVEDLYTKASLVGTDRWAADRNRLGHALVGLTGRLPKCAALLRAMPETSQDATQLVSAARDEVRAELERLSKS